MLCLNDRRNAWAVALFWSTVILFRDGDPGLERRHQG